MDAFNFYMPVDIHFGKGRIAELGALTAKYGSRAMLITTPWIEAQRPLFEAAIASMTKAGVTVTVLDQVCPNPTVDMADKGAALARDNQVDAVVGIGGGRSLDAAKAIAVGASHPGSVWDYVVSAPKRPTAATLPVITVPTTAGTGAHITQGAVITNTALEHKSAIVDRNLFPKACIVDPDLTATLPKRAWAATGFDSFTHAFESFIHNSFIMPIGPVALKAMQLIIENLPKVLADATDEEARTNMSYADTLSGISNANVGTTLPHAMGQAVSGHFPQIAHGEALALIYRAVLEYTCESCEEKFAKVACLFNPELAVLSTGEAARALPEEISRFLGKIGLNPTCRTLGIPEAALESLAASAMSYSDTYAHPRVPAQEEVLALYRQCVGA